MTDKKQQPDETTQQPPDWEAELRAYEQEQDRKAGITTEEDRARGTEWEHRLDDAHVPGELDEDPEEQRVGRVEYPSEWRRSIPSTQRGATAPIDGYSSYGHSNLSTKGRRHRYVSARLQKALELTTGNEEVGAETVRRFGHNFFGIDSEAVVDRTYSGASGQYAHLPHVDVDENIGLMLMMGLSDKLTLRELLTSAEHIRKGGKIDAIDNAASPRSVVSHLEQMAAAGKEYGVIVLRFPNTQHKMQHAGNSFNETHGIKNTGHWLRIPVLVRTHPHEIVPTPSKANEWNAQEMTDTVAQQCGFADMRCMKNSRPLGMNSPNLKDGQSWSEQEKSIYKRELTKLTDALHKMNVRKAAIDRALTVTPQMRSELAEQLHSVVSQRQSLREGMSEFLEEHSRRPRDAEAKSTFNGLQRERNKTNALRNRLQSKLETYDYFLAARPALLEELEDITKRIDVSTKAKAELVEKIDTLESNPGKPTPRFPTDLNPNLLTYDVVATDCDTFIEMANKYDPVGARNARTQDLFLQSYRQAESWLAQAKQKHGGSNYVNHARQFFKMRAEQAGMSVDAWLHSPEFQTAEQRLHDGALSAEARVARQREEEQGEQKGGAVKHG